ncbi:hypothetical protein AK830_g7678 [Neonectria ditissima]|uniref:Ysc84 actin-binding domain-containing protein n=1 Tax=Neonectria ditissima TaxID=78410 RepID=A0A0P7BD86_9HYPO|nr:hypothetical protein AK830_g7678 [Neonectria ditissima]
MAVSDVQFDGCFPPPDAMPPGCCNGSPPPWFPIPRPNPDLLAPSSPSALFPTPGRHTKSRTMLCMYGARYDHAVRSSLTPPHAHAQAHALEAQAPRQLGRATIVSSSGNTEPARPVATTAGRGHGRSATATIPGSSRRWPSISMMTSSSKAAVSSSSNNNSNSSSSSAGNNSSTGNSTSNSTSSKRKSWRNSLGVGGVNSNRGSQATTTTSLSSHIFPSQRQPHSHTQSHSHPASPFASPSPSPSTTLAPTSGPGPTPGPAPAPAAAHASASAAGHSAASIACARNNSRVHYTDANAIGHGHGHDRDRHGPYLCHSQGFRTPVHTSSTSSNLRPVIPSPSPSVYNTVAFSAASTITPSSSFYFLPAASASTSSASTPTTTKSPSTPAATPTASSSPSLPLPSKGTNFNRYSYKSNNHSISFSSDTPTSSGLRNDPSLPVLSVVPPPGQHRGDGEANRPAMQRVSAFLPSWDKRTSGTRPGLFGWSSNRSSTGTTSSPSPSALAKINTAAANANARISLGGRIQRETFWPATLDGECDKAARILKSFSTDGYLAPQEDDEDEPLPEEPQTPIQMTRKIPRRIIQNAAGIAIFTCMRSGLWMTGSGGSGILIARKSDGTWSPPSGIMLHTPTLSFIIGVDIYDCVLVINNLAALESITRPRVTLGEDVGLTSGPLVSLDSDESHIRWKDLGNTVFTYMKARGQSQTVNLHGCILAERGNENERFYSSPVSQMDILAGNVSRSVEETKPLFEVIKMAEGRSDFDSAVIDKIDIEPAPGDAMIATPMSSTPASPANAFGIPHVDDPDPYGVLALEMAGLEIREAGSRLRPTSSQFDFNPIPTSPAFSKFNRQSVDTYVTKSNRGSFMSSRTVKSQMTDAGTQTDVGTTPETTPSPGRSEDGFGRSSPTQIPEVTEEEEEVDYTKVDLTPLRNLSGSHTPVSVTSEGSTTLEKGTLKVDRASTKDDADNASSNYDNDESDKKSRDADDEDELDDSEDDEEPVVFEVAAVQPARTQAVASRVIQVKGNMVTIPKRIPPPLPMRSPARTSRSSKTDIGDVSHLKSPLRQEFVEADIQSDGGSPSKSQFSPYLKPTEVKIASVVAPKSKPESLKSNGDNSESEPEFFPAEENKIDDSKQKEETKPMEDAETKAEVATVKAPATPASETKTDPKDIEPALNITQVEHSDSSDSVSKKRASSIYTGVTEDRWSLDGSSLTTPTSDRPYSVIDDIAEDETPRRPTKEVEQIELDEKYDELKKMESKEATPNTITVA